MTRRTPLTRRAGAPPANPAWLTERLLEARAVIADVGHHSDHLIRLACDVLVRHGESEAERRDARILQLVVDARTPLRHGHHQRRDDDPDTADAHGLRS